MHFHSFVVLSLVLAVFSFPFKRDVATVESDLSSLDTQMKALSASIAAFPNSGGNIFEAIAIVHDVVTLDDSIESATSDTSASAVFTETQGSAISALLQTLTSDIEQTLTNLVTKQAALASLPIPGVTSLVQGELQKLKTDSDAFTTALLSKIPADLADKVQVQVTLIDDAFSSAITAFSS